MLSTGRNYTWCAFFFYLFSILKTYSYLKKLARYFCNENNKSKANEGSAPCADLRILDMNKPEKLK